MSIKEQLVEDMAGLIPKGIKWIHSKDERPNPQTHNSIVIVYKNIEGKSYFDVLKQSHRKKTLYRNPFDNNHTLPDYISLETSEYYWVKIGDPFKRT